MLIWDHPSTWDEPNTTLVNPYHTLWCLINLSNPSRTQYIWGQASVSLISETAMHGLIYWTTNLMHTYSSPTAFTTFNGQTIPEPSQESHALMWHACKGQWFVLEWRGEKQGHKGNFLAVMCHSLWWSLLSLHLGEEPKPTPLSLHFLPHLHWTLEANGVVLRLPSSTTISPPKPNKA